MSRATGHTSQRRHGHHQRRTRRFLKVYTPYIPLVLILSFGLYVSNFWRPAQQQAVLAYATEISRESLLFSTNSQRQQNSVGSLALNAKLNSAAQAKADDMVARNYWSHNTPDGQAPWVFFSNAGYSYQKAGENLAYGFATSSDTVSGWMNSPSHRDNLLDSNFSEVGFGYANSSNFNGSGPETVVVAMYGKPYSAPSTSNNTAPSTPKAAVKPSTQSTPAPAPAPVASKVEVKVVDKDGNPVSGLKVTLFSEPREAITNESGVAVFENVEPGEHTAKAEVNGQKYEQKISVASDSKVVAASLPPIQAISNKTSLESSSAELPTTSTVNRLSVLTGGALPWLTGVVTIVAILAAAYLVSKHSLAFHRFIRKGERYILHHAVLDVTLLAAVWLGYVLTRAAGSIL